MRRRAGFTFIEITIVVVIIGILMAIGIPRMKGTIEATRMTTAARDVTALMRFARQVAILTETQTEIRFAPDEDSYQLAAFDKQGERMEIKDLRRSRRWEDEGNPLVIGADMLKVQHLPKNVHFAMIYAAATLTDDTELPRVIFYPDGSATPTTVAMQDDNKHTKRVEIYRTTGMTRVEAGLPPVEPKAQKLYYGPGS